EVTFYERDDTGMIVRQYRGPLARWANPGWRLEQPRVFDVVTAQMRQLSEPVVLARGITLEQVALRKVDPDAEPIGQLKESIAALDAAGHRTAELKGKWWHK